MDKEHINSAKKKLEGEAKETAGELLDDASLKANGKKDKAELRDAAGDVKDKLKA